MSWVFGITLCQSLPTVNRCFSCFSVFVQVDSTRACTADSCVGNVSACPEIPWLLIFHHLESPSMIAGTLPESWSGMTSLTDLDLSSNWFTGACHPTGLLWRACKCTVYPTQLYLCHAVPYRLGGTWTDEVLKS
jgi:hypothetical protein